MMGTRDASEAGEPVNHKRVARLYTEAGLRVRRRRRKKVSSPIATTGPGDGPHPATGWQAVQCEALTFQQIGTSSAQTGQTRER